MKHEEEEELNKGGLAEEEGTDNGPKAEKEHSRNNGLPV